MTATLATTTVYEVVAAPAAQAAPTVAGRELWWFDAWQLQDKVWPRTKGAGVTVAVIDTGVNASIPELSGSVLPGGDVLGQGTDGRQDMDTERKGHGTSMAALIAAHGGGNTNMMGVAPEAKILPILANSPTVDSGAAEDAQAIRFATDHGAQVISISLAGDSSLEPDQCNPELQDAIKYAVGKDVIVVAGSGNEGSAGNLPMSPASCAGVVAVGAVNNQRKPWVDTQRQNYVDVGGPGVGVISVSSQGTAIQGDGTSPATALVSGAFALVRSAYPDMPARQVVARVLATLVDAGPAGKDNTSGGGVVVPFQAITRNVPANAPNPIFDELNQSSPTGANRPSGAPSGSPPAGATPSGAGNAGDSDDSGGTDFPWPFVAVVTGALIAFVVTMVVRRTRRPKPAGLPGAPWQYPGGQSPAQPPPSYPNQQPPPPGPPPPTQQQWPPQNP